MFMKEMSNLHTQKHTLISDLFWFVKNCNLREESIRDWEVGLWYGVRIKHMITLESIELSF